MFCRVTLDLNTRHIHSEMETLHASQIRRQKDKDTELCKLKRAEHQLKSAKDSLQLVQRKYDGKQAEVSLSLE